MQYTTHFNLNLPEGTDIVNPLVQDNPNYSAIDAAMFANKQAVIGTASEVVSGTVHAITRSNPDSDYFKFTATGNWAAGDSMSVDGTTVSVYLSDGTTPATGAYIINTEVLALLSGTRVTLIISNGVAASEIGTLSNLTTTDKSNLVNAINEVNAKDATDIYTSNNITIEQAINNTITTNNTVGLNVNLATHDANDPYYAVADGYVFVRNTSTQTGKLLTYNNNIPIGGAPGDFALYVKKGCKIVADGTSTYMFFRSFYS